MLACLGLMPGCGEMRYDDPVAVMNDPSYSSVGRLDAAAQAFDESPDSPEFRRQLYDWMFAPAQPYELRRAAMDTLMQIDPARLRQHLAGQMDRLPDDAIYAYACELAIAHQWRSVTVAVIRRDEKQLYEPVMPPIDQADVLKRLHPGTTVAEIVREVFTDPLNRYPQRDRMIAWVVLAHCLSDRQLEEILETTSAAGAFWIEDMQSARRELGVLIRTREQMIQLSGYMRHTSNDQSWESYRQVVATLSETQKQSLALRHLPILLVQQPTGFRPTRQQLLDQLSPRLTGKHHYHRDRQYAGDIGQLPWADLLVLKTLLDAISQPPVVSDLFLQADRDFDQPHGELGGVLAYVGGQFRAVGYAPRYLLHDQQFTAPDEMIEHLYHACAHYHFHAQSYNNIHLAGPGAADLKLANRLQMNGLLFTFIDRNTINVDLYLPGNRVFDLGVIKRNP